MKKITAIILILLAFAINPLVAHADLPDYVEKEMWNDSSPVYASEFYNGRQYIVQLYQKPDKSRWEMRLIELKVNDNATLSDSRYWTLDDGGNHNPESLYYNAAMKEFNGKMYIYIYCNSQNYFFSFQTDSDSNATLTKLKCPMDNDKKYAFSMVKYRNALAIITQNRGYLQATYTRDDPGSPSAVWHKNETDFKSDYWHARNSYRSADFDVTNWIGARKGKDGKMEMTEELVIATYVNGYRAFEFNPTLEHYGKFVVYHFSGDLAKLHHPEYMTWENLWEKEIVSDQIFSNHDSQYGIGLKIVEGQIAGSGIANDPTNINNPLQFILGVERKYVTGNIHQRQIIVCEYNPETRSFTKNDDKTTYSFATNLPYGKFGACSVSVPLPGTTYESGGVEVTNYQRYISIFRGAIDKHFNKSHHYALIKSNRIKVKSCPANTSDLLSTSEGRKACTLVGVIEGAPPTVVDNESMYNSCGTVSSIIFGSSESQSLKTEHSTRWGHTNLAGFDNYGSPFGSFSIMGGGGYEVTKTKGEEKTFTTEYTTSLENSSAEMAKTGYYIYQVPRLLQYNGQVYSPDGNRHMTGCGDFLTFMQIGSSTAFIDYRLDNDNIDPRIRVDNPLDLESWRQRGVELFGYYGNSGDRIYSESINAITSSSKKLKSTVSNSFTTTKKSSWKLLVKTHVYQNESGGEITNTTTSSSSIGQEVTIAINSINTNFLNNQIRDEKIKYYDLDGYYLKGASNGIAKVYYEDLINRGMMDPADIPFILAWNVVSTSGDMHLLPSGADQLSEAGTFTVRSVAGALEVDCGEAMDIEIFSTTGAKAATHRCEPGSNRIPLPPGIYIVKTSTTSVKALVR